MYISTKKHSRKGREMAGMYYIKLQCFFYFVF